MSSAAKILLTAAVAFAATPAFAHVGHSEAGSFVAGLAHPMSGLDHIAAMIAVGLWAAMKGGRALWLWPACFVGVMLVGGMFGMAGLPLPFAEQGILASVVVLGLLVALAVDVPLAAGAALICIFAFVHGHAHGTEAGDSMAGTEYMAGFAITTALLHGCGLAAALGLSRVKARSFVRLTGAACAALGGALALNLM